MSKDPSKTIVLVGGGGHKELAVRVAIRTAMVNAVVTDEATAQSLLSRNEVKK